MVWELEEIRVYEHVNFDINTQSEYSNNLGFAYVIATRAVFMWDRNILIVEGSYVQGKFFFPMGSCVYGNCFLIPSHC